MSNPALPPLLAEKSPFRERLVVFLLPYFAGLTEDFDVARTEVLETLASYGARTRAELIAATRVIALSFASLDMLHEAKAGEMPPALRLRFTACANNLNRSCQQTEQALIKRLACDAPRAVEPAAEPPNDMPDAEFEAALEQAKAQIETYRNRLSVSPRPGPVPQHQRRKDTIIAGILAEMGTRPPPPNP